MRTYCYRSEDNMRLELEFEMGEAPEVVEHEGMFYHRDFQAELVTRREPWGTTPAGWPLKSMGQSVHPSQVAEAKAADARDGLKGVSYDSDGTCYFDSRQDRNAYMKSRGMRDNDAGYGDYAGD
jgi:hypothetical protein